MITEKHEVDEIPATVKSEVQAPQQSTEAEETSVESPEPITPRPEATTAVETPIIEVQEPDTTPDTAETSYEGISLTIGEISVSCQTDYSHIDTDVIRLGNDEGVTVTIKSAINNVTIDDLIIAYEENDLSVRVDEPINNENSTIIKLYVTGKHEGTFDLAICTLYDAVVLGENSKCFSVPIHKMSSSDGRVAYVTTYGEKYHFSPACAGENAMKTTCWDCTDLAYEPCGKCAR